VRQKFGLLAGLGLAIAIVAPLDGANAQRGGVDTGVDPNAPKPPQHQKPPVKPGEQPKAPPQKAGPPPQANPAQPRPDQRRQQAQPPVAPRPPLQQRAAPQPPPFVPPTKAAPVPAPVTVAPPPPAHLPPNNVQRGGFQPVNPPVNSGIRSTNPVPTPPPIPSTLEARPSAPASRTIGGRQFGKPPAQGPAAVLPPPPPTGRSAGTGFLPGFSRPGAPVTRLDDVQKGRTQRVEAGGRRTVIQEADNRVIVKQNNTTIIRHDETQRFAKHASSIRSTHRHDGTTQTVVLRPGGVQLFNIVDNSGRLVRRYRRDDRGREINIIDNRRFYRNAAFIGVAGLGIGAIYLGLRAPDVRIPRDRYIVDYDRASEDDIFEALSAPPIDSLERAYSLEEIRYNVELRDRMRRLDVDAVSFESGSWEVPSEQFPKLERLARIMLRIIDRNPGEVFLVEGHTDAVGPDVDNLTLSDRRAQAVAEILSGVFDVPPENIVTQGYGEQFLKVPTDGPERLNRRVAVRRVTPLLGDQSFSERR
jgi:outer membrane protein OmpA-like peptidoglycan-associated protein